MQLCLTDRVGISNSSLSCINSLDKESRGNKGSFLSFIRNYKDSTASSRMHTMDGGRRGGKLNKTKKERGYQLE